VSGAVSSRRVHDGFLRKSDLQAKCSDEHYWINVDHAKAIQDLLDELEASRQARRRAWDVLQDLRAVLTNLGNVTIEVPSRKTFEAEGAIPQS
jgi:hypothetical protein